MRGLFAEESKGLCPPCRHNAFLAFAAGIRVEKMRHEKKSNLARDIAVDLVLSGRSAHSEKEKNEPWQSHFEEHLEIQNPKHPWIELCTHEEVIDRIASHAMLGSASQGRKVRNE